MVLYRSNSHVNFEEYCNIAQEMAYGLKQENEESRERREMKQRQQTRNTPAAKPPQTSTPSSSAQSQPAKPQGNPKPRSEVTCYSCGKQGHIRPNCPDKKPDTSVKMVEPAELPARNDSESEPEN